MLPRLVLALALAAAAPARAQREVVEAPEPGVLRGVVVAALTREPVGGQPVRLSGGGIEPVLLTSGDDGRFEVARPAIERGSLVLAAQPRPGWRAVERVKVGESDGPYTLVVQPRETRPVSGRVATPRGLPLAWFVFELVEGGGPRETLTTDAEGRFESTVPFAAGRVFAYASENGVRGSPVRFDNDHSAVELRIPVGERIELELTPPPGTSLSAFRAYPLTAAQHVAFLHGRGAEVRAGERPWVRFSKRGYPGYVRGAHDVYVRSDDGFWGARVPGPIASDAVPAVRLQPRGVLALTLRADGIEAPANENEFPPRALREGAPLFFTHLDADGNELWGFEGSGRPGKTREVACLAPGRWRIDVQAGSFAPRSVEVNVAAGRRVPLEIFLGVPLETDALVLRVIDARGDVPAWERYHDAPDVSAWVRGARRFYSVETSAMCGNGVEAWFRRVERGGRMVLEATLPDLPLGDYDVDLRVGGRRFEGPATARPGEPAEYRLLGSVFGFRVADAASGRAVEGYRVVELGPKASGLLSEWPDIAGVHARDVDRGDLVDWCVVAPGYRRAYGDRYEFALGPDGAWADVALEPGWAVRVVARRSDSKWAAGAVLQLGGERVELDAGGRGIVTAAAPPAEPRLVFHDRDVIAGDVDADGRFDPALHELRVTLRKR